MEDGMENKNHKIEHHELSPTDEVPSASDTESGILQRSRRFRSKESQQRRRNMRSEFTMIWINQLEVHCGNNGYSGSNTESGVYPQTSVWHQLQQNQAKHDPGITEPFPVLDSWREVLAEAGTSNKNNLETTNQLEVHGAHEDYKGLSSESAVYPQTPGCFRSKQNQEKHGPGVTDPCTVLDCWKKVLAEPGPSKRKDPKTVMTCTNELEVHRRYEERKYPQRSGFFRSNNVPGITDPYPLLECWLKILKDIHVTIIRDPEMFMTCMNQLELLQGNKDNSSSDIESREYSQASSCEKNPELSEKSSVGDLCSLKSEKAIESEDNLLFVYDGIIATVRRLKQAFTQIIADNENLTLSESRNICSTFQKVDNYRKIKSFQEPTTSSSMNDEFIETERDIMSTLSIKKENEKRRLVKSRTRWRIVHNYKYKDTHNYLRNQNREKANTRSPKNDKIIETGEYNMMPTLSIIKENEKQGLDKSRSRRRINDKDNHNYLRNRNREESTRSSKKDEIIETEPEVKPTLFIMNKNKNQRSYDSRNRPKITAEDIRRYFDEKEANLARQKKTGDGWFTALRKRLSKFMPFTSNN